MSATEEPTLTPPDELDARPDAPEAPGIEDEAAGVLPRLSMREIAEADDLETKELAVPEWSGSILLKSLSLADIEAVRSRAGEDDVQFGIHLVAATMADPEVSPEQAGLLGQKSSAVMQRILVDVLELNGLGEALKHIVERFQD